MLKLFEEIENHGKELSLKLYGVRALMSLRLEKNWELGHLISDLNFTAAESGLDIFINWDKEFVGKKQLKMKKTRTKKETCYNDH